MSDAIHRLKAAIKSRYAEYRRQSELQAAMTTLGQLEQASTGLDGAAVDVSTTVFGLQVQHARLSGQLARAKQTVRPEPAQSGAPQRPPDVLMLTVGHSPEPVLLAVAYHQPVTVHLIIAEQDQASVEAGLRELWSLHADGIGVPFPSHRPEAVADDPQPVFARIRVLAEHARSQGGASDRSGEEQRIVVDITGAKKSMVAGAFLAAGYLDLETSYVDFEAYDPILRRPLPESLRPGSLPNPYQVFQLRERGQLQRLFDARRFWEAAALAARLATASGAMSGPLAQDLAVFERIRDRALAYQCWFDGFYAEAGKQLGTAAPPTVALLGSVWPSRQDSPEQVVAKLDEAKVFRRPAVALAYFIDLLAMHDDATVEADPRRGYLRLFGGIESWCYLLRYLGAGAKLEHVEIVDSRWKDGRPPTDRVVARDKLIRCLSNSLGRSSTDSLRLVCGEQPEYFSRFPRESVAYARYRLTKSRHLRLEFDELWGGARGIDYFSKLRHKCVHWMAPVSIDRACEIREFFAGMVGKSIAWVSGTVVADPVAAAMADGLRQLAAMWCGSEEPEFLAEVSPMKYDQVVAQES